MGAIHRNPEKPSSPRRRGRPGFLYLNILESLRTRLTSGAVIGGSKLPALNQLATEFGVSVMTIRRALQALEQEGRVRRLPGVGVFAPSRAATERGGLVFISTFLNSAFHTGIATGAQRAGQRIGRALSFLDGQFDAELEMRNLTQFAQSGMAGAIVLPPFRHPGTRKTLVSLYESGVPMVVVDMTLPGIHTDFVTSDHEAAAYDATALLLSRRPSSTFFLTHHPVASSVLNRIQGYQRALADSGHRLSASREVFIDYGEQEAGYDQDRRWWGAYKAMLPVLRDHAEPLSVLATDTYAGWGVYEACRELGRRIPQDVAVIAFDDAEFASTLQPPMSVVKQSVEEIGKAAVELLMQRIASERISPGPRKSFNHVVIGVQIVERASIPALVHS